MPSRRVQRIFTAPRQKEGAGFIVTRPFPGRQLTDAETDPFLLLDAFGPTFVDHRSPGAPWHPHRGFDTVTYFKRGCGAHQDSMGNKGVVGEGEVQWMRAGSGVIHDEGHPGLKRDDPPRVQEGFQLWVNLPAARKMSPPDYMQLTASTLTWQPYVGNGSRGARVKLIAGSLPSAESDAAKSEETTPAAATMASPLTPHLAVPVLYADLDLAPGAVCNLPIPPEMETLLVFVYRGTLRVHNGDKDAAGSTATRSDCIVFEASGDSLRLTVPEADEFAAPHAVPAEGAAADDLEREAQTHRGAGAIVLAGVPLREPIARHGPFVMNTAEELKQAFADYHSGRLAVAKAEEHTY